MSQDRRTKEFKRNRAERWKHPVGEVIGDEDQIIEPTDKDVIPAECIWCDFPLSGTKAICPHCKNCQSCGMHQPQGGLDMCYLCGNKVPEAKVQEVVPEFKRIRGKRGLHKGKRNDLNFRHIRPPKNKA